MTAVKNLPPFVAHTGGNQEQSIVGVVGTLGTSDTGGTAAIMPIGVNASTGAMYVQDLSGASGTTNIQGSVQVTGGSIVVTVGTMTNTGTNVNVVSGTLTTGSLSNLAMVNAGTFVQASGTTTLVSAVTTLSNLTNGSINILTGSIVGTVVNNGGSVGIQGLQANAAAAVGNPFPVGGTDSGGTVRSILVDSTGVGRSSGSVVMTVGTLTTGTLQNLVTGTLNALAAGTVTAGTLTNLVSGTINALAAGTITTGTVSVTTGTMVLNTGTITTIAAGTQNTLGTVGNLNYGTINIDPKPIPVKTTRTTYGTTGTTGAAVFGTLVPSVGNGTFAYITGYQIVVASGTVDCAIVDGTFNQATLPAGGTNMITRGNFPAGGGIARDLTVPYVSGTGGTICYWMGGAGTAYFQIDYWAST